MTFVPHFPSRNPAADVRSAAVARRQPAQRWPRGYGLVLAALLSLGLWAGLILGVLSLLA